ncbi:hypothetical protein [Flavobacterium psychrotrophum]|uniref:hypothetical protein n=1 Tax=Flavobacterium psychrotrophum TaxID=2294119 RepID=UPI000E322328|nr:hypothetical protein [Flavobacterium psychrotrophum]
MKNIFLILNFFLLIQSGYAQKQDCGWFGNMKPAERIKQFPFNKAKKIVLISYPGEIALAKKGSSENSFIRTLTLNFEGKEKKYNLLQEKEISGKDVDSLSKLLINYTIRKGYKSNIMQEVKCYQPRNGVVFYDETGKVICFLEICFECMQSYISPAVGKINELNHIPDCGNERILYLKEIFRRNGIN